MCAVDWTMVLEYLKVFLSWPPVVAACFFAFLWIFKVQLTSLIGRIRSFSYKGVAVQAQETGAAAVTAPERGVAPELQAGMALTPDQVTAVRQAFDAERQGAKLWEFHFLNYFFVPATQATLDWLVSLNAVSTVTAVDTFLTTNGIDADNRRAIMAALGNHYLIEFDGLALRVTQKGLEYCRWPFRRFLWMPRTLEPPDARPAAT